MKTKLQWVVERRNWWLGLLSGLLLCWAVLWLWVPGWVMQEIQGQMSQVLGRKVTVAAVRFYPWSLGLQVEGLEVANREGTDWQVRVARVHADLELSSVFRMAPVIDELQVIQPAVRLRHAGQGRYDVDDLMARFASNPAAAPAEPLRFSVYNVHVEAGELDFADLPRQQTHQVRQFELRIPFVSTLPSQRNVRITPHLSMRLNGHPVDLSAQATPFSASPAGQLHVQVPGMDLQKWLPYWPVALPLRLQEGQLAMDWKLQFVRAADSKPDQIRLDGQARLLQTRWAATQGQFKGTVMAVDTLELQSRALAWPLPESAAATQADRARLTLRMEGPRLAGRAAAGAVPGQLQAVIQPLARSGDFELEIQSAELQTVRPLLSAYFQPGLSGLLSAKAVGEWHGGQWSVRVPELDVLHVKLHAESVRQTAAGKALENSPQTRSLPLGWKALRVRDVQMGWPLRTIRLGRIELEEPQAELGRNAAGVPTWQSWFRQTSQQEAGSSTATLPPWTFELDQMDIHRGRFVWWDAAASGALQAGQEVERSTARIEFSDIGLQLKALELAPNALVSRQSPFVLRTRISQLSRQKQAVGQVHIQGELSGHKRASGAPVLQLKAGVDVQRLPVHAFEPYFRSHVHMALHQADASVKGQVLYRQPQDGSDPLEIMVKGDAALDHVQASSLEPREELLNWRSLRWQGLEFHQRQGEATRVRVGQSTLADFYARLIVTDKGRFNLQDVFARTKPHEASPAAPVSAPVLPQGPVADVQIGPSRLINGRINFSDRFIQPNYSANLSELNGQMGGFASRTEQGLVQMADIELLGKAQGSALLTVKGRINPLAKPLALDIKADVRDLELPPLSPYAAKYLGYEIERGKLNVDVTYQIQPDGRLVANNNFILNQLTLGERIEGQGSSLPVKLAISLLKDRNGVIDVNLPVSGKVDDPEFRIAPIVWKLVLNLIGRALTSPFSLVAGVFGGSSVDQAGQIAFAPGTDRLDEGMKKQLDQIARAMNDRPALKIHIAGQSSTTAEMQAFQMAAVYKEVLTELVRSQPQFKADSAQSLDRADYEVGLRQVYQRAKIKKPRNLVGMAKDIPVSDMEALLARAVPVNEDTWRQLALARAQQVKDHLAQAGLALERLFLVPPQLQDKTGVALTLTAD